ncbi:hypothetical protein C8J56DRAFT_886760 [Mycena floridula]|nr:hypothetical protein C8J56DRAFT_903924 [Mycena floridula]KAJ7592030.1 hypothetical protein C8J56DRAFT_886760 [Mycena floridula]
MTSLLIVGIRETSAARLPTLSPQMSLFPTSTASRKRDIFPDDASRRPRRGLGHDTPSKRGDVWRRLVPAFLDRSLGSRMRILTTLQALAVRSSRLAFHLLIVTTNPLQSAPSFQGKLGTSALLNHSSTVLYTPVIASEFHLLPMPPRSPPKSPSQPIPSTPSRTRVPSTPRTPGTPRRQKYPASQRLQGIKTNLPESQRLQNIKSELCDKLKLTYTPDDWKAHLIHRVFAGYDSIFTAGTGYGKSLIFEGLAALEQLWRKLEVLSDADLDKGHEGEYKMNAGCQVEFFGVFTKLILPKGLVILQGVAGCHKGVGESLRLLSGFCHAL